MCEEEETKREFWNMEYVLFYFYFFKSVKCENESVLLVSMQFHKEDALLLA